MAQVITFRDYTPIARYDDKAWATARIEESASANGPWTQIDEITLDPIDTDPTEPAARNFTTELASDTPLLWYRVVFVDETGDSEQPTDPIRNGSNGRNLCTLADIVGYLPAFDANADENTATVTKLQALITAQSQFILERYDRELVAPATNPDTRRFDIRHREARTRHVEIGDLASTDDLEVSLLARDLTLVQVIDAGMFELLYGGDLQSANEWDPITSLRFPWPLGGPIFLPGMTLEVTGTWGYPTVPAFVREACAVKVVAAMRDVAISGIGFAEALQNLNLDNMLAEADVALSELDDVVFA